MSARQSLQRAVTALQQSPVLFVTGLVTALLVAPQTALGFVGQFLGGQAASAAGLVGNLFTLLTFFVTPAVVAGTLGMAREALDGGTTSLGTFAAVGRERYLAMLGAFLIRVGITLVLGLLALVVVVVGAVVAFALVDVGPTAAIATDPARLLQADVVVVGLLTLLAAALVFYGPLFFLQFFHVAVATDGAGPVEGYRRSVGLVRRNVVSTLGYSAVVVAVSLAVALPPLVVVALRVGGALATGQPEPTTMSRSVVLGPLQVALLTGFVLLAQVVVTPFQHTFARAFYAAHRGDSASPGSESDEDDLDIHHPDLR